MADESEVAVVLAVLPVVVSLAGVGVAGAGVLGLGVAGVTVAVVSMEGVVRLS